MLALLDFVSWVGVVVVVSAMEFFSMDCTVSNDIDDEDNISVDAAVGLSDMSMMLSRAMMMPDA